MNRSVGTARLRRGVILTLAVIALALKIAAPPGFMIAPRAGAFPLVICTGKGPMIISPRGDQTPPAHKTSDPLCAFAVSHTPPTPSFVASLAEPLSIAMGQTAGVRDVRRAPGRTLTAPPPPARAPPRTV
jgi:hypothetical protein